jgi:hypothetical protein
VQGNSGSPIVTRNSEVIGIATYVMSPTIRADWINLGTRFTQPRRFGIRMDKLAWVPLSFDEFRAQTGLLEEAFEHMHEVYRFLRVWVPLYDEISATAFNDYRVFRLEQNSTLFGTPSWRQSFRAAANAHSAHHGLLKKGFGAMSASVKQSRARVEHSFPALPKAPLAQLKAIAWKTPALKAECAEVIEISEFLERFMREVGVVDNVLKYSIQGGHP